MSTDLPHGQCKLCGNISFHSRSLCLVHGRTSKIASLMPQIDAVSDYMARCGKLYRAVKCRERTRERERVHIARIQQMCVCIQRSTHTCICAQRERHTESNRSKIHSLHRVHTKWENTWTKCMTEAFLKLNSLTVRFVYLLVKRLEI